MSQLQNDELSGLLDGELDGQRAGQVRTSIAADGALRDEFDMLVRLDARLRQAAEDAVFIPRISLPSNAVVEAHSRHWPTCALVVAGLLTVRFLPKVVEMAALGVVLPFAAVIVISFVVLRMVREAEPLRASATWQGTSP